MGEMLAAFPAQQAPGPRARGAARLMRHARGVGKTHRGGGAGSRGAARRRDELVHKGKRS